MESNVLRHLEVTGEQDSPSRPPACELKAQGAGQAGLRVASIFIVFAAALLGALIPLLIRRSASSRVPRRLFSAFKFVGTGVIIGTAWMHLLSPAVDILGSPCLEPRFGGFDWGSAIAGITLMAMFFVHLLVTKLRPGAPEEAETEAAPEEKRASVLTECSQLRASGKGASGPPSTITTTAIENSPSEPHQDGNPNCNVENPSTHGAMNVPGSLAFTTQLTAIFILEFSVIFHSVFIGLVLATTDEFIILLLVLVFHQLFEGLGLGARLALVPWPKSRRWLPYALCLAFAVSTPIGTAAGLGARPENADAQMLTNGVFDAVSAGILLYTGVFELMGREFFFNPHMRQASLKEQLCAYGCIAGGFALMLVLAKWA